MKRKLEQLNLMDDFLFGSVLSYPGIGEQFCRKLLKILLNLDLEKIQVVPQKVYYGSDTDRHGTRLDVYIEEDGETGTVFDVEPDQAYGKEFIKALPRRVRFYHSKIDGRSLKAGDDYSLLKKVIVILISSYDPFGKDRILYTIRNGCVEEPEMEYDDGAVSLFFYTRGSVGSATEEQRTLLNYMEESSAENADSDLLREIHRMVETVRYDKEVSLEYMKVYEREKMIRENGRAEGRKEGIKEGRKEGMVGGEVRSVRKLSNTMELSQIAELLEMDPEYVEQITSFIKAYPEEDDQQIAVRVIATEEPV